MAIKFSPNGNLDVATDPSELPSQGADGDEVSGEMTRCTNLHLDRQGIASTRKGSSKVNTSAMGETSPNLMIEQEGKRYTFNGTNIYEDEVSIASGQADADWYAVKYNAYNSSILSIFALNGINRKRITNGTVYGWGMEAPESATIIGLGNGTGLTGSYNAKYTFVRKEGETIVYESNPSDEATANQTLTNQSLRIRLDPPTDPQVNAVRIYRTDIMGANYYYLNTINVPTSAYAYAYSYDWEAQDAYISGNGYLLTETIPASAGEVALHDCDSLSNSDGVWIHSTSPSYIKIDNSIYKTGSGSIRASLGSSAQYVKLTKSSGVWDLSGYTQLKVWLYVASAVTTVKLYLGESAYDEQGLDAFSLAAGWTQKTWDISGISNPDKNAITMFSVGTSGLMFPYLYIDSPTVDAGNSYEDYVKMHSWEPTGTTSDSSVIKCYFWEPVIFDDSTADSSLGTEVIENHDRPPYGTFVFGPSYTGMLFILKDNLMHYSLEKQPEHWPSTYFIEISNKDFPCKAGCIHDGQIYVSTSDEIYMVPGTSHQSFSPPLAMSAITGTISSKCFLPIHGQGIFHLGNDGIYLLSSKDENITNSRFKPIFEGTTVGSIPGVDKTNLKNSWMICFNNKFYFGYPESGSTYPDNVMVTDLSTMKSYHYDYGQTFRCVGIDYTNNRLLALDTSGYIWVLEDATVTTDNGTAIAWQIESKEYSEQLRKYFPRWARYDVNIGTGATANGYIILNGTSKQTHTLTELRKTRKRLIIGCTGDRIAIRMAGTGSVNIYAAEVE